jgi:type IV secretion system protein VirB5
MRKTAFQTTEAGHKFIELYAEPVVTNSYLKIALFTVCMIALALLGLFYRAQTAAFHLKPLIISVSDIGRGEVMNYDDFSKIPIDRVSQYYLARWAELYYGRNHETLKRDFSHSLDFFSDQLQSATLQQVNQQKTLETFLLNPSASDVDIRIDAVNLIDLEKPPYSAQIEFEKVFRSPGDQTVARRERWTVNVVYSFRKEVPNSMLLTNPLGLVISYVHADQAFGK